MDFSSILVFLILVCTHNAVITFQFMLMSVKYFLISFHSMEVLKSFSFLPYALDGPHIVGFSFLFSFVPILFHSLFSFFYQFALNKYSYMCWVLFFSSSCTCAFFSVFIFAVYFSSWLFPIFLLLLTAFELSLGGSNPYTT